ncbi:MAG: DUF4214 domain-containing protein [Oscillospiraceae bacterium]|nr:DUF4214 domain-containing protein [Oscillospiraceae bacterium]
MKSKKILRRLTAAAIAAVMVCLLIPVTTVLASSAEDLAAHIMAFDDRLTAVADTDEKTVTVTGSATGVDSRLTLDIDSGVTVIWKATFRGDVGGLILVKGGGTFVADDGAFITTNTSGAILIGESGGAATQVRVRNGAVLRGPQGIDSNAPTSGSGDSIYVEGGRVESIGGTGGYNAINSSGNTPVTVSGGEVVALGGGLAQAISTGGDVTITGGLVRNARPSDDNVAVVVSWGSVSITGGTVFGYGTETIGEWVSGKSTGIVFGYTGEKVKVKVSGDGLIIAWDRDTYDTPGGKGRDPGFYKPGDAEIDELEVESDGTATVLWVEHITPGRDGLYYEKGSNSGYIILPVGVGSVKYSVELNTTGHIFPTVPRGYDDDLMKNIDLPALELIVTDVSNVSDAASGAEAIAVTLTSLGGSGAAAFELSKAEGTLAKTGATDEFTIKPKPGLPAGTHRARVSVGAAPGNDKAILPQSFEVSFTVTDRPNSTGITVEMWDDNKDGWDGDGVLKIIVNEGESNEQVYDLKLTSETAKFTFYVVNGDNVRFYWEGEDEYDENAFIAYYAPPLPQLSPSFNPEPGKGWEDEEGNNGLFLYYMQYGDLAGDTGRWEDFLTGFICEFIVSFPISGDDGGDSCGCGPFSVCSFVTNLYLNVLEREPDFAGFEYWTAGLYDGSFTAAEVVYGFMFSEELGEKNLDNEDFVETLYQAFFGRSSDETGKTNWVNAANAHERIVIFYGFAISLEFELFCEAHGFEIYDGRAID